MFRIIFPVRRDFYSNARSYGCWVGRALLQWFATQPGEREQIIDELPELERSLDFTPDRANYTPAGLRRLGVQ